MLRNGLVPILVRENTAMRLRFRFLLPVICSFLFAAPAHAAVLSYVAKAPTYTITLNAGEERKVTFVFTNIGSKSWTGSRTGTALYVYGASSVLGHPSWLADDLPAVISEKTVNPGQRATATFLVKAPTTPGTYRERFLLSVAQNVWMKGSVAYVTIVVKGAVPPIATPSSPVVIPPPAAPVSQLPASDAWRAELTDRGGIEWQLDPLGRTVVSLAFKNTGTSAWTRDAKNYVSLYTGAQKSPFKDSSWKNDSQAVVLKETVVKPGQIGHFELPLRAPEVPGKYAEAFRLAAENTAWIAGGTVSLPIRVTTPRDYIAKGVMNGVDPTLVDGTAGANSVAASAAAGAYKTVLLLRSAKDAILLGNGRLALTYGFKNIGTTGWGTMSLRIAGVQPALTGKLSSVRDESWMSASEAASAVKATLPGEIGFIGFTIKAPPKKGSYTASFRLFADGQPVEDGTIDIPITVTADGYIEPEPTATPPLASGSTPNSTPALNPIPLSGDPSSLPNEPIIRVGLFATTDNQMIVRGVSGGFNLTESGNIVCRFEAGESVTVAYDRSAGVSRAAGPRCTSQTTGVYVASMPDGISPLELTDYSRPVSWLPGANDNKFRGKLELRYAKATDSVWVINELPIEWYLKGIGETSNSSPQEYQRALLTAARTYAMYHVTRGTKHADENYTIDAKYDQVYRGYGAEARDPAVVVAVDATRGQIVTYQGKLALTPYYSRSDGRTRSWTEVWGGGPYAWLVSVPVPWDNGRTLWGHGVGLSATGALGMAADGKTYDQILMHFYTSTELRRAYK